MIRKAHRKITTMIHEHKHVMKEHRHMIGFHVFIAILVGVVLHMLFPPIHAESESTYESPMIIVQEHSVADLEKEQQERIDKTVQSVISQEKEKTHQIPASIATPNVSLKISEDPQGGYNLFLGTENFSFTPQRLGVVDETAYYEGHASLYINDTFVARVYAPYHYVPEEILKDGSNVILVTLNDNTHDVFTRNGDIIYDADTINH